MFKIITKFQLHPLDSMVIADMNINCNSVFGNSFLSVPNFLNLNF